MAFTSHQKRFIKKNISRLTDYEIAGELNLPLKEIQKFIRKRYPQKRLSRASSGAHQEESPVTTTFSLNEFIADNLNIIFFLFFLIFIVFFNILGNAFVSDDIAAIKNNPAVGTIKNVFSSPLAFIHNAIYFIIYNIFGLNPTPFRLVNVILHVGNTILAYILLRLITGKRILALFAATLFAIHPIHTEAVDWISAGPYIKYSFFALLSFSSYLLYKDELGKKKYLSLIYFLIAVASGAMAVVVPIILFVYELTIGNLKKNWRKLAPHIIFTIIIGMIFAGMMFQRLETLTADNFQNQLESKTNNSFESIPIAVGTYLKLIFWPRSLSFYQTDLNFYISKSVYFALFYLTFPALLFYLWKKNRQIFFWLTFFVISLGPTLSPYKVAWVVAERYVYLGALGIFVIIAMLFVWFIEKFPDYKKAAYGLFAIIVIALSIRTIVRNTDWQNEDTLWIATAKTSPSGFVIYNNLGDMYSRWGDNEKSIASFKTAIQKNPYYSDAYHNIATMYMKTGQLDLAEENYYLAIKYKPQLWQSYQNLAQIYYDRGEIQKSLDMMNKALEINPGDPALLNNLQVIKAKMQ
jgi:protein O-mannosyl-transferase